MIRLRIPRRSLHVQLTLLYAVPFLISGVLLLAIPLLGSNQATPANPVAENPAGVPGDGGHLDRQFSTSAWTVAAMVVVSLLLGWFVAGRFLRPLRTITATAREISVSDLHRRIGRTGLHNEFTDLSETLDDLFQRLQAAFESQRHFVANASHELRTPLTAERTVLQVALADPDATAERLRAACHEVLALNGQQERLIEALLTLARGEQGLQLHTQLDVAGVAAEVVAARQQDAGRRGIQMHTALDRAPATGDPDLIERLVVNLVDNAVRHNTPGGWVEISTTSTATGGAIRVSNSGPTVPPGELEALFQPFRQIGNSRTRQPDGLGHGLGLAIVRAIADAHGATLDARTRVTGGLDIEIGFPDERAVD
ncbi:sensor histidine kinase [Paractinoplanes brasiliensis]|uniref:histidine kinase n=1 Tax=Paractinoplanes brasiliensis TaxID=52695 RepID=A0A4R6JRH3_9ACTN|nr:HAMP domain-containing sensor histidine kinase [Actinoplanes brasiliensis]TDO38322.1 signal transduction histidine kinase [Actinoplanes brasiliensis]GID26902.1 two-component sensor histidine kinase [Actinoplanes brasiliensis]